MQRFKAKQGGELPSDFMTYLEVLIGGEAGLLMCESGEYNFSFDFEQEMFNVGLTREEVDMVKIWSSDYPKEHPICGYWTVDSTRFAV